MSDTPRTDVMVTGNSDPCPDEYEDLASFCRQLERENADLLEALEAVRDIVDYPYQDWTVGRLKSTLRAILDDHESKGR